MISIDHYLEQHEEIISLLKDLKLKVDSLDKNFEHQNAVDSKEIILKVSSKLKVHLTMEDKYFYPQLLSSPNLDIKSTAQRFMDEMGGLSSVFSDYINKWSNIHKIESDCKNFTSETRGVINAILKRIDEENEHLYPLIKKVSHANDKKIGFFEKIAMGFKRMFSKA